MKHGTKFDGELLLFPTALSLFLLHGPSLTIGYHSSVLRVSMAYGHHVTVGSMLLSHERHCIRHATDLDTDLFHLLIRLVDILLYPQPRRYLSC